LIARRTVHHCTPLQLGHEHVQGAHIGRFGIERPERTATIAEQRAAERGGVSAKEAKALGTELWNAADSGKALNAALEAHGWQLARGDKTRADGGAYFMAIDPQGEAHDELRRMMPVKAAAFLRAHGRRRPGEPAEHGLCATFSHGLSTTEFVSWSISSRSTSQLT
jgi:hypothetical protein